MDREEIEEQVTDILEEVTWDISDKLVRVMEAVLELERKKAASEVIKELIKKGASLDISMPDDTLKNHFIIPMKDWEDIKKKYPRVE